MRLPAGLPPAAAAELTDRFQQLSGPVMAKGVEDTAFYRYNRLLALNEVGGDPTRFGVTTDAFHRHNQRIAADWPATMTTTSTHDTKRSEDVRARLALLSEIPDALGAGGGPLVGPQPPPPSLSAGRTGHRVRALPDAGRRPSAAAGPGW